MKEIYKKYFFFISILFGLYFSFLFNISLLLPIVFYFAVLAFPTKLSSVITLSKAKIIIKNIYKCTPVLYKKNQSKTLFFIIIYLLISFSVFYLTKNSSLMTRKISSEEINFFNSGLLAPVSEEIFFRSILFWFFFYGIFNSKKHKHKQRKYYFFIVYIFLSGFFFGLVHFDNSPLSQLLKAIHGVALSLIYILQRSLFYPTLLHMSYNMICIYNSYNFAISSTRFLLFFCIFLWIFLKINAFIKRINRA